jgi:hypothetical protein
MIFSCKMWPKTFLTKNEISGFLPFREICHISQFWQIRFVNFGEGNKFCWDEAYSNSFFQFLGVLPSFPNAFVLMTIVDVRRELSLIDALPVLYS